MKFNICFFIIIYCLSAVVSIAPCDGNNLQKYKNHWLSSDVQIIDVINDPERVRYCGNKQLVISNQNGDLYNVHVKMQESPKLIGCHFTHQQAAILQVDGKKMMICQDSTMCGYDVKMSLLQTYLPKTFDKNIRSFAWNPLENTLFLCYGENDNKITSYNYNTDEKKEISLLHSDQICQIMTIHPQKKVICLADYLGNVSLRNIDDTLSKIKTIDLTKKLKNSFFCQYSSDGSRIIVGNAKKIFIIDPNTDIDSDEPLCINVKEQYKKNDEFYSEEFINVIFYPKNSILATLCFRYIDQNIRGLNYAIDEKQLIRYWNFKTGKLVDESPEFSVGDSCDFCFSANGFEGIVIVKNKCVRIHISFAIKDRCIYYLCVLNQLKDQTNWPQDIVYYCGNILLESFKF